MSAFTEIVAEVLAEHRMGSATGDPWYKQDPPQRMPRIHTQTYACKCKSWTGHHGDHIKHQTEVLAERLGVTERVEIGGPWVGGDIRPLPQQDPEGDWYVLPTHQRTVTAFAHVGEWEACDA